MHWKREHGKRTTYLRECITCGETFSGVRQTAKFCDDLCKGLHYSAAGVAPPQIVCQLPKDHPVRVLIRERAQQPQALRVALEAEDWPTLLRLLEERAVKVDGCWLWPRADKSGYGRMVVAGKSYGAHRLAAMAHAGGHIPSHMPVHHACAEPLCINPAHLQVVTPHENAAEMLERGYYQERIAALEGALRLLAPTHELVNTKAHGAPGPPLRLAS